VSGVLVIVLLVGLLRIGEVLYAQRNARALIARGGVEIGSAHYPLFFLLHGGWLLALFWVVPGDTAIRWGWLGLFLLLQLGRVWVIASLGAYWTTRVITIPGEPLVRRGPYRFLRHPNYLVVALEIAVLPLVFGAWPLSLVFSLLNGALLAWRIRIEDRALASRREP
jgi:methyltransferase